MNQASRWISLSVAAVAVVGCRSNDPRPVPRVPVPMGNGAPTRTYDPIRPLRGPTEDEGFARLPPPAFDDAPLVTQAPPEQPMYVDAYDRVGQPRIAVFVNRTVEGEIIAAERRRTLVGVERTQESTGAVDIESSDRRDGPWDRSSTSSDRFKTNGPARVTERAEVYLEPGQYDEVQAKAIDYQAIELALSDTLAANGRVTLVSPMMARQRLSDDEVKELQAGRPKALREVAEKLDADVLIQVQARPTKQTSEGLGVRILVEAINTRGGESIARSFVDVPPPLDKQKINNYTRFLARKTMYELAGTWSMPPRERQPQQQQQQQQQEQRQLQQPPATTQPGR